MGKRFRLKEVHIKFLLFVVILVVFALIQPKVFTAINLFSMLNDAVFTGIGTAGTNVVDTLVFGESFSFLKIFFIALLLAGVIGLKLVTHRPTAETANLPEAEGVS